ncbi:MAG: STN domain-containing protein [Candidatus Pseudobacter hemicellulosilyticus]|uniref:STN domain-containing protein n=1 Tax=Candidatus Pseudobacter hemicellulosilyticus TaxID=3121375 RepID=A0AAJ5WR92_9BACT|nr:MAG: STN domain-containing protein [Pseudobacter sp.]
MNFQQKYCLCLCLAGYLFFHAPSRAMGQEATISIQCSKESLETVFSLIRKQTGYRFVYSRDLLLQSRKVTINIRQHSIEKVLEKLLSNQPLVFHIVDKYIVIRKKDKV